MEERQSRECVQLDFIGKEGRFLVKVSGVGVERVAKRDEPRQEGGVLVETGVEEGARRSVHVVGVEEAAARKEGGDEEEDEDEEDDDRELDADDFAMGTLEKKKKARGGKKKEDEPKNRASEKKDDANGEEEGDDDDEDDEDVDLDDEDLLRKILGDDYPGAEKRRPKLPEERKKRMRPHKPGSKKGVLYLGHIPNGFFEHEMMAFFSQFGDIARARVSRSQRTGNSRGYAFVRVDSFVPPRPSNLQN